MKNISYGKDGLYHGTLLAVCHPTGCTVSSSIVGVVVSVCNRSQMRTSKCTCLIFGVSIGQVLTLARNAQKEYLIGV